MCHDAAEVHDDVTAYAEAFISAMMTSLSTPRPSSVP